MGFKYQGFDFIGVDGSLTEEELLVRRSVREFVEERVTPRIEEWFREGRIDRGLARPSPPDRRRPAPRDPRSWCSHGDCRSAG